MPIRGRLDPTILSGGEGEALALGESELEALVEMLLLIELDSDDDSELDGEDDSELDMEEDIEVEILLEILLDGELDMEEDRDEDGELEILLDGDVETLADGDAERDGEEEIEVEGLGLGDGLNEMLLDGEVDGDDDIELEREDEMDEEIEVEGLLEIEVDTDEEIDEEIEVATSGAIAIRQQTESSVPSSLRSADEFPVAVVSGRVAVAVISVVLDTLVSICSVHDGLLVAMAYAEPPGLVSCTAQIIINSIQFAIEGVMVFAHEGVPSLATTAILCASMKLAAACPSNRIAAHLLFTFAPSQPHVQLVPSPEAIL